MESLTTTTTTKTTYEHELEIPIVPTKLKHLTIELIWTKQPEINESKLISKSIPIEESNSSAVTVLEHLI